MSRFVWLACSVVLLAPAQAIGAGLPTGTCAIERFDGIRTLIARVSRENEETRRPAEDIERNWQAAAQAIGVILGADLPPEHARNPRGVLIPVLGGSALVLPCDAGAVARDRLASKLNMLGYSLDDISRVASGGATRATLDRDQLRRAVGLPPAPLASQASASIAAPMPPVEDGLNMGALRPVWAEEPRSAHADGPGTIALTTRLVPAPASRPASPAAIPVALRAPAPMRPASPAPSQAVIEWWMRYYAMSYGVDYRLVAAVIRQESNGQTDSVSHRGALGLMQLMPATAAMLRVDPRDPIDNLRGGIAYLAGLLSSYRSVRTALIAYNAGPAHADSVVRGERQPYPETQRYLQAVDAVYPIDQRR